MIDRELMNQVQLTRRLVELGRAARAESKIKIRQPLARAIVAAQGWEKIPAHVRDALRAEISEELNVVDVAEIDTTNSELVNISVKANFKSLGARYGGDVQAIAKVISASDPRELVTTLRINQSTTLPFDGKLAEITLDDLVVTETPKEGWSFASHNGESVALDLNLTPELIEAGLVREIIRAVQDGRKNAGLDVSDRIHLTFTGTDEIQSAISRHSALISDEVLATSISSTLDSEAKFSHHVEEMNFTFAISQA
jgi:isoleucyl-tRNA synthetase